MITGLIGGWKIRFVRWAIVFEREPAPWKMPEDWVKGTRLDATIYHGRVVDLNKHYSVDDIKRWQEEIRVHLGG